MFGLRFAKNTFGRQKYFEWRWRLRASMAAGQEKLISNFPVNTTGDFISARTDSNEFNHEEIVLEMKGLTSVVWKMIKISKGPY